MRICNEGYLNFSLKEYEDEEITFFTLDIPKSIDTKEIDIKLYKDFVSIRVKGKLT